MAQPQTERPGRRTFYIGEDRFTIVVPPSLRDASVGRLIRDSSTIIVGPGGERISGPAQEARTALNRRYTDHLVNFLEQTEPELLAQVLRMPNQVAAGRPQLSDLTPRREAEQEAPRYARGRHVEIHGRQYWVEYRAEDLQREGRRHGMPSPDALMRARIYPARNEGTARDPQWVRMTETPLTRREISGMLREQRELARH
ncbi:MAG: hypothetical protein ABII71_03150 [Candidatus Micrarchaeota archaeon]